MSPKKYSQRLESLFTEASPEAADTPAAPSAGGNAFARFFELAADGFVVTDAGGHVTQVNAAFARLTGLAAATVVGQPFLSLLHPDDHPAMSTWGSADPVHQFTARTRSATAAWVRLAWDAHTDLAGEGYFTARPAQERDVLAALSELNLGGGALETLRLLQRAIEAGEEAVSIADMRQPDAPLVYVNRAFEHTTGYSAAETLGRNCRFLQGADRHQPEIEDVRAALRAGRPCTVTLRNYRKDGTLFYNRLEMSPVRDEHGVVTHFLGLQNDVTAEVRAQQALERRNRELSAINAITRAVATGVNMQTLLGTAGQTMMELFGVVAGYIALYDAEKALIRFPYYMDEGLQLEPTPRPLGQGLTSIVIQQRDALLINELNEEAFTRLGALKIQTSGKGVPQSWLGVPLFDGDQVIGVLNVQDMQPQRFGPEDVTLLTTLAATLSSALQKTRLVEKAQLYADVMTNAPIGLYVWHLDDPTDPLSLRLAVANAASKTATGVEPSQVLGKTIGEAFPNLISTDIPELYADIALGGLPTQLGEITYEDERIGRSVFDVRAFPLPGQRIGVSFENITLRKQAAAEFERLAALQKAIVQNAGYAVVGTDTQGVVTLFNPAAEAMLGYTASEVVGQHTPEQWVDPADLQARAAEFSAELGQPVPASGDVFVVKALHGLPNEHEWVFVRKDGRRISVLLNVSPIRSEQGHIVGFVSLAADLTERKQAEQALRDSEQRLSKLTANVPGMLYQVLLRPDGTTTFPFISQWGRDQLGLNPAELAHTIAPMVSLIHPDDLGAFQQAFAHSAQTLTQFVWEGRFKRPNGDYMMAQAQSQPEALPTGGILWNGVFSDITERKQAEQALRQSEQRLTKLAATVPGMIFQFVMRPDGSSYFPFTSQWVLEQLGVNPTDLEAEATPLISLIHPDDMLGFQATVAHSVQTLVEFVWEGRIRRPDATYVAVQVRSRPELMPNGNIMSNGILIDITERKQAEAALQASAERFRLTVERTGQLIYDYDVPTDHMAWAGAIQQLTQFTPAEFATVDLKRWEALIHPDDRPAAMHEFDLAMAEVREYRVEYRFERKDGSYFYVRDYGVFLPGPDGSAIRMLGTMSDITEQKQAEQQLHDSEQRFRALAEATREGVIIHDQGLIMDANPAMSDLFGYAMAEVRGKNFADFLTPETRPVLEDKVRSGDTEAYEVVGLRRDGSTFPIEAFGRPVPYAGKMMRGGIIRDISERKKTEAANARRARDLARVADINAAIIANQDVQAVAETVTRLTQRAFELYHCRIFLLDEAAQELGMAAESWEEGDPHAGTHGMARIPLHQEQSLVALAARTQQAVIANDTQNDPHFLPNALLPRTRAEMAVPIVIGGRLVGVFDVQADARNAFDDIDQFIYTTLAAQVGASIQEARFFAEVSKRALELETVARVSTTIASTLDPQKLLQDVVDLTKQAFNLYHAHIYLLNASGDKLMLTTGAGEVGRAMVAQGRVIPIESERSLVAQAARTRAGIIRNDARSDPSFLPNPLLPETRSELAVPLVVGDTLLGVFDVQADIVNRFTADDVRTQTTLAAQVAVAWQNAQRYEATRQRAERERLMNEIAQKIQTAATVSGALQVAAQELARATRAQQVRAELRPATPAADNPVAGD